MGARLIVNADDFGLTRGVNRGVGELSAAGALSSTTLMANGLAFDDAVRVARSQPKLGVGCHVVLTDGVPVCAPETVRSLLGPDRGRFRPKLRSFIQALAMGRISAEDIEREALAQVEKIQRAGIRITHLDTHKHTHLFPTVLRPLLEVAERAGIRAIRSPFEPAWSQAVAGGGAPRRWAVRALTVLKPAFDGAAQIQSGAVRTTEGTTAISATGHLDAETLRRLLEALPAEGTYELCCHPGYNDAELDQVTTRLRAQRDVEREALEQEVPRADVRLISYAEL